MVDILMMPECLRFCMTILLLAYSLDLGSVMVIRTIVGPLAVCYLMVPSGALRRLRVCRGLTLDMTFVIIIRIAIVMIVVTDYI